MARVMTVHLGAPGVLGAIRAIRGRPKPGEVPGLVWADAGIQIDFTPGRGPSVPHPGRVGMYAVWEDEAAAVAAEGSRFLAPFDWHVRLEPVRAYGSWGALPEVPRKDEVLAASDPVAVTTLAHTKPSQFPRFARASMPAERAAGESPANLVAVGIVRPLRFVSSFSMWTSVEGMQAFAHPRGGGSHPEAIAASRRKPFHDEEVFLRHRIVEESGTWPHRRDVVA